MVVQAEDSARDPQGPVLTTTSTVFIEILDIQDQPPVFLNTPYRTVMMENSRAGQSLVKILVRDGDTGQPRNLQLDIINDSLGYFRIGSFSMSDGVAAATIVSGWPVHQSETTSSPSGTFSKNTPNGFQNWVSSCIEPASIGQSVPNRLAYAVRRASGVVYTRL